MQSPHIPIGQGGSGVRIEDLAGPRDFKESGTPVDPSLKAELLRRLEKCMAESADRTLQELVQMAIDYCHGDSSGISLEEEAPGGALQFRWVAVAGSFARYLNGVTPRFYSPCGTCLDRGTAQRYQVTVPYYNFLGLAAEPILDGILIPWHSETRTGTIWLISHRSEDTFTRSDYELLKSLADFVGVGIDRAKDI